MPDAKQKFISECIADCIRKGTPKDQAAAICYSKWEKEHSKNNSKKIYKYNSNKQNQEIDYKKFYDTIMQGGLSVGKTDFPEDQLQKGISVEYEHINKDSPYAQAIAEKIAKDHLAEMPDYYDKLAIMEKGE